MTDVEEIGSEGRSVQADPIQRGLVTRPFSLLPLFLLVSVRWSVVLHILTLIFDKSYIPFSRVFSAYKDETSTVKFERYKSIWIGQSSLVNIPILKVSNISNLKISVLTLLSSHQAQTHLTRLKWRTPKRQFCFSSTSMCSQIGQGSISSSLYGIAFQSRSKNAQ